MQNKKESTDVVESIYCDATEWELHSTRPLYHRSGYIWDICQHPLGPRAANLQWTGLGKTDDVSVILSQNHLKGQGNNNPHFINLK